MMPSEFEEKKSRGEAMTRLLCRSGEDLLGVVPGISVPSWVQLASRRFREVVCNERETFPCYFGTIAEQTKSLRYTYVEDNEIEQPWELLSTLTAYLQACQNTSKRSALVVFAGTGQHERSLGDYEAAFWRILQFLHDHDPLRWPAEVPADPDDPLWAFCFAGQPVFISGHSPLHQQRRSRWSPAGLLLVVLSREHLADIDTDSAAARAVRRRIRGLMQSYDTVPLATELTLFYGDPRGREWRQYWLDDAGGPQPTRCPLTI